MQKTKTVENLTATRNTICLKDTGRSEIKNLKEINRARLNL